MNKVASVVVAACLSASSVAMAGHQFVGSFDDIRAACQNPTQFQNQIAPKNVQVSCKDVRTHWIPDTAAQHGLETSRNITLQVNSDKYTSNSEMSPIPTEMD